MLDYPELFRKFSIPATGALHVGGFIGWENATYEKMGFASRLFIEAQPNTFRVLQQNLAGTGALCESVAISDREGSATFHVVSNGQSSSLLELKEHARAYPDITEVARIEVRTTTLDALLARPDYAERRFNFINIDIQGAELRALTGAVRTLETIDAINTEINFDELYQGAPHVRQLDAFLGAFGFVRVDTVLLHRSWGDGFYVKDRFTKV